MHHPDPSRGPLTFGGAGGEEGGGMENAAEAGGGREEGREGQAGGWHSCWCSVGSTLEKSTKIKGRKGRGNRNDRRGGGEERLKGPAFNLSRVQTSA